MSNKFSMDSYIDVAERIQHFKDKYPDGSLQTLEWDVKDVGGRLFVWYHAAAYRTADDECPGQGIAWEPFPGPTPYTKDSELMNAETAAWGRAIVALGLTANRKIASRQEVRARVESNTPKAARVTMGSALPSLSDDVVQFLVNAKKASGMTDEEVRLHLISVGVPNVPDGRITLPTIRRMTQDQADELLTRFEKAGK